MTKVLFISYYFPPMGGAGVQRSQKFVEYLPSEGFLPIVVAGPTRDQQGFAPPDATLMSSLPGDVKVHRVPGPVPSGESKMRARFDRLFAQPGSFAKWWIKSATETACRAAAGARLIFATMSPFESAAVAGEVSRRLGIPWVADLRDPWALDEMMVYPSLLHRKIEMHKMQRDLASAAAIVMNTPDSTAAVKNTFRLRSKNIVTITNGFDGGDFAGEVAPRTDGKFRIVHAGFLQTAMGQRVRDMRLYHLLRGAVPGVDILTRSHVVLIEAIKRWCQQQPHLRQAIEIVFAGDATAESVAVVNHAGLSDVVRFAGYLPHAESLQLTRTADLLFLPMHNLPPGHRCRIVPGKTYEYMASGRPILAAVPDGDARDFLTRCGTALICRPDDVPGMMRHLERAYQAWESGNTVGSLRRDFVEQFERRQLTRRLAEAFRGVLNSAAYREEESSAVWHRVDRHAQQI